MCIRLYTAKTLESLSGIVLKGSNANGNSVNHSTSLRDVNGCLFAAGNPATAWVPGRRPDLTWFTYLSNRKNLSRSVEDNRRFANTVNRDQSIVKAFKEHPLALAHWIPNPY
jgi:hypothetical protein